MITNKIIPPATYTSAFVCMVGLPCNLAIPTAFEILDRTLHSCNPWNPDILYFTVYDTATASTIMMNQEYTNNTYAYSFTPTAAQLGMNTTHYLSVD
jgi:hypothetical protein